MKKLILMCGVPGSGKSTYLATAAQLEMGEKVISRDIIRFCLIQTKDAYFSKEKEVFNEYINQIQEALDTPGIRTVYADATQVSEKSRMKVLNRLDLSNTKVYVYWKNTPLQLCLERNAQRTGLQWVPEEQIRRMYFNMQDPRKDKFEYAGVQVI